MMHDLERSMRETNPEFKSGFPKEEWLHFIEKSASDSGPDLILAGHFHPRKVIVNYFGNTTGLVVPDWFKDRSYITIDHEKAFSHLRYFP